MKKTMMIYILIFFISFFSHTAKAENMQPSLIIHAEDETSILLKELCKPLQFTRSGIRCFLKQSFNRKEYAKDFLPHNFTHLLQFLDFGKSAGQNATYFQSTLRLFSNKLKSTRYINAYAYADMLEELPRNIDHLFKPIESSTITLFESIKNKVKETLYNLFLSKFTLFKTDPEQFFDTLSDDILQATNNDAFVTERVEQERLAQHLVRFLEITMNKIIWSPADQEEIWESIKVIAKHLETMLEKKMITNDNLDDLYKSLIERFCYFLEATGTDLSLDVITTIKKEIQAGDLLLVELEEQEQFIETKKQRLLDTLITTEARILARSKGILSEVIATR